MTTVYLPEFSRVFSNLELISSIFLEIGSLPLLFFLLWLQKTIQDTAITIPSTRLSSRPGILNQRWEEKKEQCDFFNQTPGHTEKELSLGQEVTRVAGLQLIETTIRPQL